MTATCAIGLLRWKEPGSSSPVPKQSADANQDRSLGRDARQTRASQEFSSSGTRRAQAGQPVDSPGCVAQLLGAFLLEPVHLCFPSSCPARRGLLLSAEQPVELYRFLGAREATIFSKRGSPRSESHSSSARKVPSVGPLGTSTSLASCSSAKSRSPTCA
jgi:hypothetical protein